MKIFKNNYMFHHAGVIVVAANTPDEANYVCSHSEKTAKFFYHENPLTYTELKDENDWWSDEINKSFWEEIGDWDFIKEPCMLYEERIKVF